MTLASWTFASFLGVTWALFRLAPPARRANVLLAASLAFYAWAFRFLAGAVGRPSVGSVMPQSVPASALVQSLPRSMSS